MGAALFGLLFVLTGSQGHTQSYSIFSFDAPSGLTLQRVQGMNNTGQILGTYADASQAFHSLLRSADGATFTAIEVPGATQTFAVGLNNLGQVIGTFTDASGTHSFIRAAGGTISTFDIPPDSGLTTRPGIPAAMNDKGDIVGTALSAAAVEIGFFLSADRSTYTTIQVPRANATDVLAIDNNGDILGTCQFGGSFGLKHGFLRTPDRTITLIDAPGKLGGTSAIAGNNRGQVIASGLVLNPDGSSTALDPTLAGAPTAIDDSGRLAGCTPSGAGCRGFLAVPAAGTSPLIRPMLGVVSASGFGGSETIAPGSWVEIYGSNLAPATRQWQTSDFNGNTAPTALDGVSVTINGRRAFVSYISPGQVNAQVPSGLTPGPAQITVTNGGQTSGGYRSTVAAVKPGVLAISQDVATTYARALFPDFQTYALPSLLSPTVPPIPSLPSRLAQPGDTLILYGIGFGSVTPDLPAGQVATQANMLQGSLTVLVGGKQAQVTYAGAAPGAVGLYQFNIVVPDGVHGVVPLSLQLNGDSAPQQLSVALAQ